MHTVSAEELELFEQAVKEATDYEGEVRTGYSGRGMFGTKCLGIVCDDSAFSVALKIAKYLGEQGSDEAESLLEALTEHRVSQDNMGRSMIYYWTQITCEEEGED